MGLRVFQKHKSVIAFLVLIFCASLVWRVALARQSGLEASFLDVGQGDAIFLEFPDSTQVLIDGGPDATVLAELSEVMPPWDRSLDLVILTHPDADHLAGILDVLKRYDVARIAETGIRKETQLSRAWEEAIAEEGAEILIVDQPTRIQFGDMAVLDLLWPQESHAGEVSNEPNRYAIASQLTYGENRFLFTADIERWSETQIVASGILRDVDVLKIAHHGSKTSTSELFLDAVKPEIAVISVGASNRYGHPHPSVLDRLARYGIQTFRTDQDGRVTITSNGEAISFAIH